MSKSKIHIEKGEYTALIQDTENRDIRVTVTKGDYVLISILFSKVGIVRQRSFEHNGVKVPIDAIRILKQSAIFIKETFNDYKDLRMADIDSHVN